MEIPTVAYRCYKFTKLGAKSILTFTKLVTDFKMVLE